MSNNKAANPFHDHEPRDIFSNGKKMRKVIFGYFRIPLFLLATLLVFQGCVHVISKEMRERADKTLTFREVQTEPDRYVGKAVIWGGVIIETLNRQEGTFITVLQTPLVRGEEPRHADSSQGRFQLKHPSRLDPEIYKKGRKVSVAGKIIGKEVLPIGGLKYTHPLILAEELHLWKEKEVYAWKYYPYPYYRDYWYYYGPRWRFHHHHHHHRYHGW
jgi:outer membrane lipoprotein